MTHRLVVAALACSLVLSGCLGGSAGAPDQTTGTAETPEMTETTTTIATAATTATATTTATTGTDPRSRHRTYLSHEALADNASFSVPDPEVPETFAFESGILAEFEDGKYVAMAYHDLENGTLRNVVSIRKAENESAYDLTAGSAATVGDRDARYVETDGGGRFLWTCGGYVYRVSVQQFTDGFGENELRDVAESVGCE